MRQTYVLVAWLVMLLPATSIPAQSFVRHARYSTHFFNAAQYRGLEWRNIGPFRGGRSVAVAGVVQNPMVYYMGSTGGGVWKTEDAGISWKNISDGFFNTGSVGAIAVSESDPNIIYVGMGEHAIRGVMTSHGDGIYKSTDSGKTWTHLGLSEARHIAAIQIHPQNPDVVFVAVQGAQYGPSETRGIFKSTDGGQTWNRMLYIDNTTGASDLSIDPSNPRVLYAGMWDHRRLPWKIRSGGPGSGIFKSTDGGKNWRRLAGGLPGAMGKVAVDVSPADPEVVYANIEAENGGVFRSDDGGETWRQTTNNRVTVGRAWYYIKIVADPQDVETVYVLNEPMLKSVDGGKTFEEVATPHGDQHHLWINPLHPDNLILANDGGACISFNGGRSWSSQTNQPTGQFYRVNTDRRFPYFVYGAQQDNSSVAIPSRTAGAGIGWQDWYPVAGCESGFIAFDPDDPKLVYGGCYQGNIEVYDHATQQSRDVMAYPVIGLATPPVEMKYRFNWNAPIVAQPQHPNTIYHAGNKVLKTTDGGFHWKEISPDLTRNEPGKQMAGGGPYTNEGAGAENYNTISYLACSPHQAGVLWVGTDDGLVHLTRNEGETWENVTPKGIGEALINCIEVSPHDPAAAYIVTTRYKFDDLRPSVYYTGDFGKSWKKITEGIAGDHFVRVVREDPVKPGLLYAGTEAGFYISFNNGDLWHPFQLNLPVCSVTDLQIRNNDLVASTSGRGFWILDDLGAIQQSMGNLSRTTLFQPKPTVRFATRSPEETVAGIGENPLDGLIVDYYLPQQLDSQSLVLQVLDEKRRLVRSYTNQQDDRSSVSEEGPAAEKRLSGKRGLNRFHWDLRRDPVPEIPDVFVYGGYEGSQVGPGTYILRLVGPADTLEQTCRILPDPRLHVDSTDYREQQEILYHLEHAVKDLHQSVIQMRQVKKQVAFLTEQMKKAGCSDKLIRRGKRIEEMMTEWEAPLIQTKQETPQDVINFPNHLNAEMLDLLDRVDTNDPRMTEGARLRTQNLLDRWTRCKARYYQILDKEVAQFNELFKEQDIPVVVVPSSAD